MPRPNPTNVTLSVLMMADSHLDNEATWADDDVLNEALVIFSCI